MSTQPKYKRILLKLTGEMFCKKSERGIDLHEVEKVAIYIKKLKTKYPALQIAIVVGAGNLFRGREVKGSKTDRAMADYIGMLGTVMNALALQTELENHTVNTRVLSALTIQQVCEPFIRRRAIRHLEKGRVVILGGGTGNPFFTTDSAAALKACELNCDILLKGSTVEGVFSADPKKDKNAKLYKKLSYQEALEKGLTVMDNTAFALCQREKVPIIVFSLEDLDNIENNILGKQVGTLVE